MIITTTYTAESKAERKALMLMNATLQGAGLDVDFEDEHPGTVTLMGGTAVGMLPPRLTIKESRRARKSKESAVPVGEERERIQREAVDAAPKKV